MAPISAMGHTDPNRIAQIANYLRFAWGHEIPPFELDLVKKVQAEHQQRKIPWTLLELGD